MTATATLSPEQMLTILADGGEHLRESLGPRGHLVYGVTTLTKRGDRSRYGLGLPAEAIQLEDLARLADQA
mgnify:CR=1 FL=1